jgi:hypothetical protein
MPSEISIGDKQNGTVFIGRSFTQKWLENESDLVDDDEYELFILKHDENHDVLVEQKEGTLVEEDELKTPS